MAQMNLSTKQKQTSKHREQTVVAKEIKGERGMDRDLGLVDANYYI